jgi:regulator of protease activity HflC (stomatin/prohibitin superfamily)
VWNVKKQEITQEIQVPSSEGLIVGLDATLIWQYRADRMAEMRQTIGSHPDETILLPYFRDTMRAAVAGFEVKQIYSDKGRRAIASAAIAEMREDLEPQGFIISDVLLRDVKLPEKFKEAIEAKLAAEQKVAEKEFERQQAVKEAEIEVARASGAAQAQTIINSTLTENYLRYRWIETLNKNPNVIYVATEANLPIFKTVH